MGGSRPFINRVRGRGIIWDGFWKCMQNRIFLGHFEWVMWWIVMLLSVDLTPVFDLSKEAVGVVLPCKDTGPKAGDGVLGDGGSEPPPPPVRCLGGTVSSVRTFGNFIAQETCKCSVHHQYITEVDFQDHYFRSPVRGSFSTSVELTMANRTLFDPKITREKHTVC